MGRLPPPATGARRAASPLLLLTRRRLSASPPTAATSLLLALPFELLIRIISLLDSAVDVAWTAAVSRVFRDSLADEGMRLREQEGGYEVPNAPEGECPKKWRLFVALMHDANRHQRIAAGSAHSIFVDEHARLSSCGKVLPAAYLSYHRRLLPASLLTAAASPPHFLSATAATSVLTAAAPVGSRSATLIGAVCFSVAPLPPS